MDATAAVILASISIFVTVGNFIYRINFDTQSQRRKNALDFMAKVANDVYMYRTAHVDKDQNIENVIFHSREAINPFASEQDKLIDHKAELAKYIAKSNDMRSNVLKTQGALISDRYILPVIFAGNVSTAREALIELTFYEKVIPDRPLTKEEKEEPYKDLDRLVYNVLKEVHELYDKNNLHKWSEESLRFGMESSFQLDSQKPEKLTG